MRFTKTLALITLLVGLSVEVGGQCHVLLLGAGKCGAGASSPMLTNMVAYYELNEAGDADAIDAHDDNDLAESASDTIASTATAKQGTAREYAIADTEYFFLASNADLTMGDINFTLCTWLRPTSTSGTFSVVTKDDDAANSRDYTLDFNPTPRFYVNGSVLAQHATSLADATWYMVCGEHDADGDTVGVSINDGAYTTTATAGAVPNTSSAQFRLGAREYSGFEHYFDGIQDETGIWKRKLTLAERTWLYNSGNGRSYADIVACSGC